MDDTLIRRVMPNSAETEKAVIGCILMDKDKMTDVADILVPDDFIIANTVQYIRRWCRLTRRADRST